MTDLLKHFEYTVAGSSFVGGAIIGVLVLEVSFWMFAILVLTSAAFSLWHYWRLP